MRVVKGREFSYNNDLLDSSCHQGHFDCTFAPATSVPRAGAHSRSFFLQTLLILTIKDPCIDLHVQHSLFYQSILYLGRSPSQTAQ